MVWHAQARQRRQQTRHAPRYSPAILPDADAVAPGYAPARSPPARPRSRAPEHRRRAPPARPGSQRNAQIATTAKAQNQIAHAARLSGSDCEPSNPLKPCDNIDFSRISSYFAVHQESAANTGFARLGRCESAPFQERATTQVTISGAEAGTTKLLIIQSLRPYTAPLPAVSMTWGSPPKSSRRWPTAATPPRRRSRPRPFPWRCSGAT